MTSNFFATEVDELLAYRAIEETLNRFIRGIDRQDWPLALSTYHEDAHDEHGFFNGPAAEFIERVAKAHVHQEHSMHFMSNLLIDFQSRQVAIAESYFLVFQRFSARSPGVLDGNHGLRKFATARYIDRFEERNGKWRVAHRVLLLGDMQEEQMTSTLDLPTGFVAQKHSMDDYLYHALSAT